MAEIVEKFIESKFPEIKGEAVNPGNMGESKTFARDLGHFLLELKKLDTSQAELPSFENAFAGSDLAFFEAEMEDLLKNFKNLLPKNFMTMIFEEASKKLPKKKLWLHGNFSAQNILVDEGKLSGVLAIDKAVVGDPACDLAIAWSLFDRHVRKIFFGAADADKGMIDRARIHAVRGALKTYNSANIDEQIMARDALAEILEELGYQGQDELFDDHIDLGDVNGIPGTL